MPTERVQRRIDGLLDHVEEAVDALDWDRVRETSQAVLRVDPENADALEFIRMAGDGSASTNEESQETTTPIAAAENNSASPPPTSFADGRYNVSRLLGEGGKK